MARAKSDSENSSDDEASELDDVLFSEGEKVLAYHGPKIYEAKVQKAEVRKGEWRYFVHYLGWNKNWDEWVEPPRLLKNTPENVEKQKLLDKKKGADKNVKSVRSTQTKTKSSTDKEETKTNATKGKKRKAESTIEKDNDITDKYIRIEIPTPLRKQLVDDWEYVTQQNKLVRLPRSPTVDEILTQYLEHCSKKDGIVPDSIGEILKGIRTYFDKALPVILLYKKERQQYKEAMPDKVAPSSVYGAEHLLRLFVKLPELLPYVEMEEETLIPLQQKLLDFLKYLQKNQGALFLSAYDSAKASEAGTSGRGKKSAAGAS